LRGRRKELDRLNFAEYCLIIEGYGRGHVRRVGAEKIAAVAASPSALLFGDGSGGLCRRW
jgi:hypothetical protein